MKLILTLFLISVSCSPAFAKNKMYESAYQKIDCAKKNGKTEVIIDGGRIDCETRYFVIEYDFSKKWAECLGQALFYAASKDKIGICSLIVEDNKDLKYVKKLQETIDYHNLYIGSEVIRNLD